MKRARRTRAAIAQCSWRSTFTMARSTTMTVNDFGKLEKIQQKLHPRTNMGVVDEHMEWQMTENERGDTENRQESVTGLTWADEHNGGRLSQKHPSDRLHYKPGRRRCKVRSPSWIKACGRGAGRSRSNVGRRDGDQRQIRSRRR